MSQKSEIKSGNVSIDAGGGNGYFPAGAGLKWVKVYFSYSDLVVAAITGEYTLALPDNCIFLHCVMNVTTPFSDFSQYDVNIGSTSYTDKILAGAPCTDVGYFSTASSLYRSGQDIKMYVTANANLDTATVGQLELNFLYATVP